MSENTASPQSAGMGAEPDDDPRIKVSKENAELQVQALFDEFEMERKIDPDDPDSEKYFPHMVKSVMRGRLEIVEEGAALQVRQIFKSDPRGKEKLVYEWRWRKLGIAKSRIGIVEKKGVELYGMSYKMAAPMLGLDIDQVCSLHPVDLSLVEVMAGFFQKI